MYHEKRIGSFSVLYCDNHPSVTYCYEIITNRETGSYGIGMVLVHIKTMLNISAIYLIAYPFQCTHNLNGFPDSLWYRLLLSLEKECPDRIYN